MTIAQSVFAVTDNLATALQSSQLSAAEGRCLAEKTVTHLKSMRSDEAFDAVFQQVIACQQKLGRLSIESY